MLYRSLLRDELAQRLDQERISQRFPAGPVNICTLMPMRSIPFKVVCLLGMNDGVYPRQLAPLGFDLMSQNRCGAIAAVVMMTAICSSKH